MVNSRPFLLILVIIAKKCLKTPVLSGFLSVFGRYNKKDLQRWEYEDKMEYIVFRMLKAGKGIL
jgi:hypothetical protein